MSGYTYRVVDADGRHVDGTIVEQNFSGETRHSPDATSLLEVSEIAARASDQSGQETRVLRDDGTVARVYRGVAS